MIRSLSVAIAVLLAIAALFLLPIELPYSVEAPGRIMPLKEWVLVRGRDGAVIATLYDHVQGSIESYAVTDIDRGDHVTVRLHAARMDGAS